jgi:type IV pilus assembly protein PilC
MPMFAHQSMNPAGKLVRGRLLAANLADLELRLKRMELDLIDGRLAPHAGWSLGKRTVGRKELINFCFLMEQVTGSGVPVLHGLGDLRDGTDHPGFREVIADMIENIEGGMQLSAALAQHPAIFDSTFTSLIMAGEHSGTLAEVFKNLCENLKWQDELAAQTKKLLLYPALVGTVVMGVTFFLMIYLVPQLTAFIKNMGEELPIHTQLLIFVSGIFVHYWYLLLTVPLGSLIIGALLIRYSERARYKADQYKLRIWVVGPILHKIILARFVTFFAMMYGSGITVLECLRLSEGIVSNLAVAAGVRSARQMITEGHSITAAFQNTGTFPLLVIRMLKAGEATGSLDGSLRNVSYFYNREIKELIERLQSIVEPAMTVILGLLLGWIMLSVLGPIYDTISKMKT